MNAYEHLGNALRHLPEPSAAANETIRYAYAQAQLRAAMVVQLLNDTTDEEREYARVADGLERYIEAASTSPDLEMQRVAAELQAILDGATT